jgi:hypothetical protein
MFTCNYSKHQLHLILGKHRWRSLQTFTANRYNVSIQWFIYDFPIKKNQGVESLFLGRGGHLSFSCRMGKKLFDIRGTKKIRVGFSTKIIDVSQYPLTVCLLGATSVMMIARHLANLIHELFQAEIWSKFMDIFLFTFHILSSNIIISGIKRRNNQYDETLSGNFPCFII